MSFSNISSCFLLGWLKIHFSRGDIEWWKICFRFFHLFCFSFCFHPSQHSTVIMSQFSVFVLSLSSSSSRVESSHQCVKMWKIVNYYLLMIWIFFHRRAVVDVRGRKRKMLFQIFAIDLTSVRGAVTMLCGGKNGNCQKENTYSAKTFFHS